MPPTSTWTPRPPCTPVAAARQQLRAVAAGQTLPTWQRAGARRFQGLDAEIAATLGGSEATARANVYQALKKLRTILGGT
jgi:DNA-directed RNA polymerase specialized sigma24 family protein